MNTSMPISLKRLSLALLISLGLISSAFAAPGGNSGGGGYGGDVSQNMPRKSPEQRAVEQYLRGVKYRDEAIAFELEAVKEDDDKKKQKLLKKAQKEYANAQKRFERTLKTLPNAFEAHSDLGFVLRKQGNYDESLAAYNKALSLNPNYWPAIEYRGEAFLALNDLEAAKEAYMILFREDRQLADVLMAAMRIWLRDASDTAEISPESKQAFSDWIDKRLTISQQVHDLSPDSQDPWQTAAL